MGLTIKQLRLYFQGSLYFRRGGAFHAEPPPPYEDEEITTEAGLQIMTEASEIIRTE